MRKLRCCALTWLAAFTVPQLLGYSVRAAALCCVLAMALTAVPVMLGVEELTKGTPHDDQTGPGGAGRLETGTAGTGAGAAPAGEGGAAGGERAEA